MKVRFRSQIFLVARSNINPSVISGKEVEETHSPSDEAPVV